MMMEHEKENGIIFMMMVKLNQKVYMLTIDKMENGSFFSGEEKQNN